MDIYTTCIYESADFDHTGIRSQGGGPKTKSPPSVQKGSFRCAALGLAVLCLLMLAGIIILSIRFTSIKQKLQNRNNNCPEKCPDRWTRFGSSCYFKSTESKTWSDSRRDCQDKGADLVMINSKEEQEFINELNMRGESWIGLERTSQKHEWKWVDGSLLTEMFWAPGKQNDTLVYYAACCDSDGKWTKGPYESKTFICEK
ncbi:C-type lectin domain family 2 member B-like [Oreochromis niloticus]|uniref:C-type lectin domain family 2 member B-like n=1 Tax=Oreochromis niloticus TaxID=8128 RepID=UPI000DF3B863|nr:C-type lectin domain family 2 member B-like [Oreochromis niloticus]